MFIGRSSTIDGIVRRMFFSVIQQMQITRVFRKIANKLLTGTALFFVITTPTKTCERLLCVRPGWQNLREVRKQQQQPTNRSVRRTRWIA
jgi:hypothetical protein